MNKKGLQSLLEKAKGKTIAVVGDIMIDRYFIGDVDRISPEAPVPVVTLKDEHERLGGAANVAVNLANLGVRTRLFGVIGTDDVGDRFLNSMDENKISNLGITRLFDRPTTIKTRVIGSNQHIVRIDREVNLPIDQNACMEIIVRLGDQIREIDGIIIEDYNKGLVTINLIRQVIALAQKYRIPVFVDPKFSHFFDYQNVSLFKPNLHEAEIALSQTFSSMDDFKKAAMTLRGRTNADNVLITLGSQGMLLYNDKGFRHYPSAVRKLSDVSGAGDTVIATLSATFLAGAELHTAIALANVAAGAVISEVGIVPITSDWLLDQFDENKESVVPL